jgi:hypothetical protein
MAKEVWVYRNLRHGRTARPLYSVMQNGRVVRRVRRILLTGCRFVVREGGRLRTVREGRKNVHAFVVGTPVSSAYGTDRNGKDLPAKISYNPYKASTFMSGEHPVKGARAVLINERGVSACYTE